MLAAGGLRDDDDAQRARIAELERKLQAASSEIAVLEGATTTTRPGAKLEHSRISNGPVFFQRDIALPYAISEVGYEAVATVLRTRLRVTVTQVGRTLTVPNVFSLERVDGGTRIRLTGDWRGMPSGVIAVTAMTAAFSGMLTAAALAELLTHGLHTFPVEVGFVALATGLVGSLTAGVGWPTRRSVAESSRQLLAAYEGTLAAIEQLAEEHAVREVVPTRVEADAGRAEDAVTEISPARATRRS